MSYLTVFWRDGKDRSSRYPEPKMIPIIVIVASTVFAFFVACEANVDESLFFYADCVILIPFQTKPWLQA